MAKVNSLFEIQGNLQGLNFYLRKGVATVRKAGGGFTANTLKNSPTMERVRANGTEFGHCSSVNKILKQAMRDLLPQKKDLSLHSNLMHLLLQVKNLDTVSSHGKRRVEKGLQTEAGRKLFISFPFNTSKLLEKFHGGEIHYQANAYSCTLQKLDLSPQTFPKGATHIGIQMGIVVMDFSQMKAQTFLSEEMLLNPQDQSTTLCLQPKESPMGEGMTLAVLRVAYYQKVADTLHILHEERFFELQVLDVYGY